jgi:hypothetical protein
MQVPALEGASVGARAYVSSFARGDLAPADIALLAPPELDDRARAELLATLTPARVELYGGNLGYRYLPAATADLAFVMSIDYDGVAARWLGAARATAIVRPRRWLELRVDGALGNVDVYVPGRRTSRITVAGTIYR